MIPPLIYIPMFNNKYHTTHKVQMHTGALRKLLYGLHICTGDKTLSKFCGLSSHTDA